MLRCLIEYPMIKIGPPFSLLQNFRQHSRLGGNSLNIKAPIELANMFDLTNICRIKCKSNTPFKSL